MKYKAVLFDFDYTLVDSSEGIVHCFSYALDKLGHTVPHNDEIIKNTIGLPLEVAYQEIAKTDCPNKTNDFLEHFRMRQENEMVKRTYIYPEVKAMLTALSDLNCKMGIVSSKTRKPIEDTLVKYEVDHHFDMVLGLHDVKNPKPHPEGIYAMMDSYQVHPHETLFVGDSIFDASAAQNAGVDFVPVLTGTTKAEAFDDYKKIAIINKLHELVDAAK